MSIVSLMTDHERLVRPWHPKRETKVTGRRCLNRFLSANRGAKAGINDFDGNIEHIDEGLQR